jgi:hypothetical protein
MVERLDEVIVILQLTARDRCDGGSEGGEMEVDIRRQEGQSMVKLNKSVCAVRFRLVTSLDSPDQGTLPGPSSHSLGFSASNFEIIFT